MREFSDLDASDSNGNLKGAQDYRYTRRRNAIRTEGQRYFVSWDGEAAGSGETSPQDYCLIGNSRGGILRVDTGRLSTDEILAFLIAQSEEYPNAINVAFGFNYDVNHILRDLSYGQLRRIHSDNVAHWRRYRLEWFPGKWFTVTDVKRKSSIRIYDTVGFWHTNLIRALESEPTLVNDARMELIREGKKERGTFTHAELDSKVIPYFQAEMEMHAQLCERLRQTLAEARVPCAGTEANLVPTEWYGPSAVVRTLYQKAGLKKTMARPESDLWRPRRQKRGRPQRPDKNIAYTLPDDVNEAARASFAGGRFEQFKVGMYEGECYGYDITSAYPDAQTYLPQLARGYWQYVEKPEIDIMRRTYKWPPFGFYWIYYDFDRVREMMPGWKHPLIYRGEPPHPLFRRDEYGTVSYPPFTAGWYPMFSAANVWELHGAEIVKAYIWVPDESAPVPQQPFADPGMLDFNRMYELRDEYANAGREDLKYAVKITLNSGYGKTAQKKGVSLGDNLPAFHQIEWAATITDHCRMKIWQAAMVAWKRRALVSVETDAIYTTQRIPALDKLVGPGLGKWKREEYSGLCYLQSGIYFTRGISDGDDWRLHYRGISRDSWTIDDVLWHLGTLSFRDSRWAPLFASTKNFVGIGLAGISVVKNPADFYAKWLTWPQSQREIKLGANDRMPFKREHHPNMCQACIEGIPPSHEMHDLVVPPAKSGTSIPRKYAWVDEDETFNDPIAERWN